MDEHEEGGALDRVGWEGGWAKIKIIKKHKVKKRNKIGGGGKRSTYKLQQEVVSKRNQVVIRMSC